ncbi:MAG TPA: hypothetical protein P5567_02640 [Kiritimatiellia bacterium]|nr:hypothetical protein [Kiritimatiellia bacterium]HRZ11330.1 hypothetical protein [Kiritimatiellia bacterium]HSA17119.1 hypothetical protein [Kiritimatiellia bacterium]
MKKSIVVLLLAVSGAWGSGTNFIVSNVPNALTIDAGIKQPLRLVRGITYHFDVFVSSFYSFLLTTSSVGGSSAGMVTNGVVGFQPLFDGDLRFTPDSNTPDRIYYQSPIEVNLGAPIDVFDPPELATWTATGGLHAAARNVFGPTAYVDRAASLAAQDWTPVATNASGQTNLFLVLPAADPAAVYRLRMELP